MNEQKDGATLIADERQRQKSEEAFQDWQDDEHMNFELVHGANSYLQYATAPDWMLATERGKETVRAESMLSWNWHGDDFKPSDDRIRNLVKAGAMIAAEIDRLQRMNQPTE